MSDSVSDEELERALAEQVRRDGEVGSESQLDDGSQANLRRWVDSMRRAMRAADGKPESS
jgi:hypothetical protein